MVALLPHCGTEMLFFGVLAHGLIRLRFALAFKCGNAKRQSVKRRKQSTKAKLSLREIVRRKQKKRNMTPRMRSVAAKIVPAQLKG